jgi:hypothetical protein
MADYRKSFRPRRLAFGGRRLPRGRMAGAAFVLTLFAAMAHAEAQDAAVGLRSGTASLGAGRYDKAIQQLSATVNDDNASTSDAAKALYLRGIAYRKIGQPARAISDLGAAIWLGLPTSDKVRAQVNKGLAYRAVGMSSQAEAEMAEARRASSSSEVEKIIAEDSGGTAVASAGSAPPGSESPAGSGPLWSRLVPSFGGASSTPPPAASPKPPTTQTAEAAPTSPSGKWSTSVSSESSAQSGNRVSRWFGSLTGSSSDATPMPAPSAAPASEPTPPPRSRTAELPAASSWAVNTETEKVVSRRSSSIGSTFGRLFSRSSTTPEPTTPAATGAGYTVQLANSRSEAEAKALWKKVSSQNQQLASAQPQIEKIEIGSFGTFYSLKIGPFSGREESTRLCNALKRGGTDCSVVGPDGP